MSRWRLAAYVVRGWCGGVFVLAVVLAVLAGSWAALLWVALAAGLAGWMRLDYVRDRRCGRVT